MTSTIDPANRGERRLGRSIAILYRRAQSFLTRELEPIGLSAASYAPLLALYREDGQNQEELAGHVGIDKAAVKRAVDSLVECGFVLREDDKTDGRAWRLRLTSLAADRRPDVQRVLEAWEAIITEGFSAEEKAATRELLDRMVCNLARRVDREEGTRGA